jgi:2-oxoacid:acceptor oxidoreductase gamma subunit (pyruvate/2-ketoisovalerate family)
MVMAAEMLVNAIQVEGLFGNSIPYFGFERRGAPVAAFVRFDQNRIREKTQIYAPECLIVSDDTLLKGVDVFSGLRGDGILILNTHKSLDGLSLPATVKQVGLVHATKIALDILGSPITNTAMLGAFASATGWIRIDSILSGIEKVMPARLASKNMDAARTSYEQTRMFRV